MTRLKTLFFILLEFLAGLVFGILGGSLSSLFNPSNDVVLSILLLLTFVIVGILTGIGIVGYFYLKQIDRLGDFIISMTLALIGIVIFSFFLGILYNLHNSILFFILPMIGAIIGFNYKTRRVFRQNINNQFSGGKAIDTEDFKTSDEKHENSNGHIDNSHVTG